MSEKIKIVIVDDHSLVAEAWSVLLNSNENFTVVGIASNSEEAEHLCFTHRPQIVLMDINLANGENGFDLTRDITGKMPLLKVIGLSMHNDISLVKKFIANGARGYLSKNDPSNELFKGILEVHNGKMYVSESLKEKFLMATFSDAQLELTSREIEIVRLTAKGLTSKEVSEKLFISPRTVETHRHNILKKFHLQNTAQLIAWAKEKGYV